MAYKSVFMKIVNGQSKNGVDINVVFEFKSDEDYKYFYDPGSPFYHVNPKYLVTSGTFKIIEDQWTYGVRDSVAILIDITDKGREYFAKNYTGEENSNG